jgi:4'-phosphopantetheinyl transferase
MNDLLLPKTFEVTKDSTLWSRLRTSTLESNTVHVWSLNLNVSQNDLAKLFCLLSREEKNKANRFHDAKTRDAFIARRGLLRILLGHYLHRNARDLRFTYNAFGKPTLAGLSEPYKLHFNVSHTDNTALIAMSCNEVGIDVERVDVNYPCQRIAEEFFAPDEVSVLHTLPFSELAHTFFRYWTAKEAVAKAIGKGFSIPLDKIQIELFERRAGYANVLFSTCDVWHFCQLELWPSLVVALASRNPVQHVIYCDHLTSHTAF